MKAGIVINAWKLPIFERHLSQAGYAYENAGILTADTLLLRVDTDTENAVALERVCRSANEEAARSKMQ